MIDNIKVFFDSYSYDQLSGKLTLTSNDGATVSTLNVFKQASIADTTDRTPDILSSMPINAENGSYALIDVAGGKEVYYRINNEWVLCYKPNIAPKLTIPYYDNTVSYVEKSIISFNKKKYTSIVANTTIGVAPDTVNFDYSMTNKAEVNIGNMSGLVSVNVDGSNVMITTLDAMYIDKGNGIEMFNSPAGGDTKKVCNFSDLEIRFENNLLSLIKPNGTKKIYPFNDNISSITTDVDFIYIAITGENKIYKLVPLAETYGEYMQIDISGQIDISKNNSYFYINDNSQGRIRRIDTATMIATEISTVSNIKSIGFKDNGLAYMILSDGKLYSSVTEESEWKQFTVNDMFKRTGCPYSYVTLRTFSNVVDNSKVNYSKNYNDNSDIFTLYGNQFIFIGSTVDNIGKISKVSIANGIFSPSYTGEYIDLGVKISGLAYFNGELIVSTGMQLKVIDLSPMIVSKTVDLTLSGSRIVSISSNADTLYVLNDTGKVYKYSDIDAQPSDVISLEISTSESRICAIDSTRAYLSSAISNNTAIWEMSLDDGTKNDITPLNRHGIVDMDTLYDGLYVLDGEGTRSLTKFKTEYIRREV